eukprot:7387425-Prymnesium_polylepis.3
MLLSLEPDTILVPSGEKLTERTKVLWALVCSSTSASVDPSAQAQARPYLDHCPTPPQLSRATQTRTHTTEAAHPKA